MTTTLSRLPESARSDTVRKTPRVTVLKILLACGVVYPVLYVLASDGIAATLYDGYSRMDQAVSELSGTAAPTRWFLTAMLLVYTALMVAFGIGVRKSAAGSRALRVTGNLFVAWAIAGLLWLPFPMSSREDVVKGQPMSVNDIGHLVMSGLTLVFIMSALWFGAKAFGRRFRLYSLVTAATVVVFGVLMSTQAPNVPDPTPWMGLYERVMMWAWFLWIATLAIVLLRTRSAPGDTDREHVPEAHERPAA
jgi:Protein of unknown function (DUF998)